MSVTARCLGGPLDGELVTTLYGDPIAAAIPQPLVMFESQPRVEESPHGLALKTGTYGDVKTFITPSGERVAIRLWNGPKGHNQNCSPWCEGDHPPRERS